MDSVPIQTYVMEYNEELVREAINRELARSGQVYYVYNRVRDIDEMTTKIQAACAGGKCGVCTWTDERDMSWKRSCIVSSMERLMYWCLRRL